MKKAWMFQAFLLLAKARKKTSTPTGIRTPVTGLRTRCPRPLDDRGVLQIHRLYDSPILLRMDPGVVNRLNLPILA